MDKPTVSLAILKFLSSNILAENVSINAADSLREKGVDSYAIVEIVLFIERQYDYIIPDVHLTPGNFETVDSIATLVSNELATR